MTDQDEIERLKTESANRLSEIEALRRALLATERENVTLQARLGVPSIVRNVKARCHSCGAEVMTAENELEERVRHLEVHVAELTTRIRQLEARVAELGTESSANESAYLDACDRAAAFQSEAEDLRKQLDAARHTLDGISDARVEDWQALLERAETAEARVSVLETHIERHVIVKEHPDTLFLCDTFDKAVSDAVDGVPLDVLRGWIALDLGKGGRCAAIATAELARRAARHKEGVKA